MAGVQKGTWRVEAIPWEPLPYMEEYLIELEAQLRAPSYIAKVKLGLAHFSQFCQGEGVAHPAQITRQHLLRFQAVVNRHEEWKKSYKHQILKYVRGWTNWLARVGYIAQSPWHEIRIGRVEKQPNPLSDDEVASLFEAHRRQAFQIQPFAFHRREVILTLLYAWGLRVHELLALNVTNVDVRLDFVNAINKGGGRKTLPYGPSMKRVIQRYLPLRARQAVIGEDALLIDQQGRRLSHDMVYKIVTELGHRAGVAVHPHQLRDTCGTHLLDSDVEVERVMQVLGHSNIRQTLAYSKVNNRKVAEAHERAMDPRLDKLLFQIHNTSELGKKVGE